MIPDGVRGLLVADPVTMELPLPLAWLPLELIYTGTVLDDVIDWPVPDPATREEIFTVAWLMPLLVETGTVPDDVIDGPVLDPATKEEAVAWLTLLVPGLLV